MSRIIRFVLMVQFLIFVTMAAQTPAAATGGPVCQDVMCAVGSHCDAYADCDGVYQYCISCAPDDTGGSGGTGGTGGAGPAVPEPTSALLFAAGIAVAALSTKVMRRK